MSAERGCLSALGGLIVGLSIGAFVLVLVASLALELIAGLLGGGVHFGI